MRLDDILIRQDGVVARRQAVAVGLTEHEIRRRLRRREWAKVHPGVYVDHTGPLTWQQRAWAAVLVASRTGEDQQLSGAALCLHSAVRAADGKGRRGNDDEGPIHVGVERTRGLVRGPAGVVVHYLAHLEGRVLWNTSPPRLRYEEAALDVALAADDDLAAIAALAQACQSRRTTAARLLSSLGERARVPRRAWLAGVLSDVAEGTSSVLEHGYLTLVERPHGLPTAERQQPATASVGVVYRDAAYGERIVELDGRLFHDTATKRDQDFERDLDAAVEGRRTVRLTYGQVFARSCTTAAKVARILLAAGVPFEPRACGVGCPVGTALGIAATG